MTGRLIGLIGKKRSGKDTFAAALVEAGWQRYAFADPMKEALLRVDPIVSYVRTLTDPDEYGESHVGHRPVRLSEHVGAVGWDAAKGIDEVRRLLQHFGGAVRELDRDFWVGSTMGPANDARVFFFTDVVITDVRFPNEAESIRDYGGTLVRITRPGLLSTDQHESENLLNDYEVDAEVINDGDVADLQLKARKFL